MPLFAIYCVDKPGHEHRGAGNRSATAESPAGHQRSVRPQFQVTLTVSWR
jgi:hypothetical protein